MKALQKVCTKFSYLHLLHTGNYSVIYSISRQEKTELTCHVTSFMCDTTKRVIFLKNVVKTLRGQSILYILNLD